MVVVVAVVVGQESTYFYMQTRQMVFTDWMGILRDELRFLYNGGT